MKTIGFVGLGMMGQPMSAQLVASGFDVLGYDVSKVNLEAALTNGVIVHDGSLSELAEKTDLVILMLPNGDIVRKVVMGDGGSGLKQGLGNDDIIVDMSSASPIQTLALAKELEPAGVHLVDAPVSGNVSRARTGELTIMAGGDELVLERVREVLEAMSREIHHVGPVASGHAMKSLNNLVSASGLIATGESLIIGKKFGLDSQKMLDVLNVSTGRNNSSENKIGPFVLSRAFDGGFALNLMAKDVSIALELARSTGTPALHSTVTRELVEVANKVEADGSDHTAVIRLLEGIAGIELK